jgi:hypothetical protein
VVNVAESLKGIVLVPLFCPPELDFAHYADSA